MSTLPPEGHDGQEAGTQPDPVVPAEPTHVPPPVEDPPGPTPPQPDPTLPPQAPQPPTPPPPPAAPQYAAPPPPVQPPQYAAPQQPAPPYNAAPPAGGSYGPPPGGYQAPPGGGYQAPPGGGYQQPYGYGQPVSDPVTNITLNYWLSVFFTWIPALIFFIVEKDKGNAHATTYHRENLNFSLLRVGVLIATWIFGALPVLGGILGTILGLGSTVLFVFHIIAAAKAPEGYRQGQQPGFIFNIPLVK